MRPLKRILCVFDGEIVPFSIDGIESGDTSEGHRFMGSAQPFKARNFDQYADGLASNFADVYRFMCFIQRFAGRRTADCPAAGAGHPWYPAGHRPAVPEPV